MLVLAYCVICVCKLLIRAGNRGHWPASVKLVTLPYSPQLFTHYQNCFMILRSKFAVKLFTPLVCYRGTYVSVWHNEAFEALTCRSICVDHFMHVVVFVPGVTAMEWQTSLISGSRRRPPTKSRILLHRVF